jgi:hypothetical protein
LTFAGDYELGVPDGTDPDQELAYEYPPGVVVDVATPERAEMTIAWGA